MLDVTPLTPNALGHTPMDDFAHFCASTGLNSANAGPVAFAWAQLAYLSARTAAARAGR